MMVVIYKSFTIHIKRARSLLSHFISRLSSCTLVLYAAQFVAPRPFVIFAPPCWLSAIFSILLEALFSAHIRIFSPLRSTASEVQYIYIIQSNTTPSFLLAPLLTPKTASRRKGPSERWRGKKSKHRSVMMWLKLAIFRAAKQKSYYVKRDPPQFNLVYVIMSRPLNI